MPKTPASTPIPSTTLNFFLEGRALRMHPLITVMMIFSGGMLGGVYGLLLAMPLLGIFSVLGQMFAEVRGRYLGCRVGTWAEGQVYGVGTWGAG